MTDPVLSPGEWAVLGVVTEGPTHGFAVSQLLAESGDLGRIWSLPRPTVYQAMQKLLSAGLIAERASERSGSGPTRRVVGVTPRGRRMLLRWLGEPVQHVRDVRSLLLLKLALIDRAGGDCTALLTAQRDRLVPQLAALAADRARASGFERVLLEWRLASSRATVEFLDAVRSN